MLLAEQVPKSIADRAPDGYAKWDQTKGDIRFAAPSLLGLSAALKRAQETYAEIVGEELRAVRLAGQVYAAVRLLLCVLLGSVNNVTQTASSNSSNGLPQSKQHNLSHVTSSSLHDLPIPHAYLKTLVTLVSNQDSTEYAVPGRWPTSSWSVTHHTAGRTC